MKPVHLAEEARDDARQIWDYLAAAASPETADRVLSDLLDEIERLGGFPGIGVYKPGLGPDSLRFQRVHSHYIVYEETTNAVLVVRILHSARDLGVILSRGP